MRKVLIYSLLLLLGLAGTQVLAIVAPDMQANTATAVKLITMFCLSFIMIHVGYEFDIDKSDLSCLRVGLPRSRDRRRLSVGVLRRVFRVCNVVGRVLGVVGPVEGVPADRPLCLPDISGPAVFHAGRCPPGSNVGLQEGACAGHL